MAIITGRKAKLLEDRCATLGISHLYQGQSDKLIAYRELLAKLELQPNQVAYVGDDLIDWPVMAEIGLSVAVADAHPLLLPLALITSLVLPVDAARFVSLRPAAIGTRKA